MNPYDTRPPLTKDPSNPSKLTPNKMATNHMTLFVLSKDNPPVAVLWQSGGTIRALVLFAPLTSV